MAKNQHESYELTEIGASLHQSVIPLGRWTGEWSASVDHG